jgi:hypothetical protein
LAACEAAGLVAAGTAAAAGAAAVASWCGWSTCRPTELAKSLLQHTASELLSVHEVCPHLFKMVVHVRGRL